VLEWYDKHKTLWFAREKECLLFNCQSDLPLTITSKGVECCRDPAIIVSLIIGIAGIEAAYHNCVHQIQLYGPTNFAPVINHVTRFAQEEAQKNVASVSCDFFFILDVLLKLTSSCTVYFKQPGKI